MDMVPAPEWRTRTRDFIKRFGWKGHVFEISAITRAGCSELVTEIQVYLDARRQREQRAQETQLSEDARAISSIDANDPRFKLQTPEHE